jgi:hypothetical protein
MAHPAVNWGDPQTPDRFFWLVSTAMYRVSMSSSPFALVHQLGERLDVLWTSMPPPLLLGGIIGLASLATRSQLIAATLALTCITSIALSAQYNDPAAPIYLLPCETILCSTAGYLAIALNPRRTGRGFRLVGLTVGLAACAVSFWQISDTVSLYVPATDGAARSYTRYALTGLPAHAVVLATGDYATFTLWYGQFAQGLRPDVAVVSTDLLAWNWYRGNVERRYPWLRWGGAWQPDSMTPSSAMRALLREQMLIRATSGIFPLYVSAPSPGPGDPCDYQMVGYLWRCAPLRN